MKKSQQILPIKNRLDKFQILELEGFKSRGVYGTGIISTFFHPNITKDELLLKYHKALEEAEKRLKELEEQVKDELLDLQEDHNERFRDLINKL